MRNGRYTIDGMVVNMLPTGETFTVHGNDMPLAVIRHSREDGHACWYCECGKRYSGKKDPMLAHVVHEHGGVPYSEPSSNNRTLEAMLTPLKLTGKHADPVLDEVMFRLYGTSA